MTENKVIHTLIVDFFSHGLRSVKIEQELEKSYISTMPLIIHVLFENFDFFCENLEFFI